MGSAGTHGWRGWSLSLKLLEKAQEQLWVKLFHLARSEGTFRPSCRSPGACSVTGGIFCPFWLKYCSQPLLVASSRACVEKILLHRDSTCRGQGGHAAPAQLLPSSGLAGTVAQAQPGPLGVRAARLGAAGGP